MNAAPRARTIAVFLAAIALATYASWTLVRSDTSDFVAFYCGGAAVRDRADPYRTEPLRACEHRNSNWNVEGAQYVIPDPLPPYDQALFSFGSLIDMSTLRAIWLVLLFAAFLATAIVLARISGFSLWLVSSTLLVSDFYCSALLGQMPPLCILGIAVAGWALERDDRILLTLGLMLALIEPHIGLPAVVGTLLLSRRGCASALLAVAGVVGISLVTMPIAETIEYVTRVLPAHALSEINAEGQYGVSYQLHLLGVSETTSVSLGRLTYVLALGVGLVMARRAQVPLGRAAVVFVPCAIALIGSPFLHLTQMAAAIPAAILVAARTRTRIAGAALALLSIPWMDFSNALRVFPIVAATLYALLRRVALVERRIALWLVVAALGCLVLAANYEASHEIGDLFHYGIVSPNDLPETVWKTVLDAQEHRYTLLAEIAKIPTETALLVLAFATARVGVGRPRQALAKSPTSAANCSS